MEQDHPSKWMNAPFKWAIPMSEAQALFKRYYMRRWSSYYLHRLLKDQPIIEHQGVKYSPVFYDNINKNYKGQVFLSFRLPKQSEHGMVLIKAAT